MADLVKKEDYKTYRKISSNSDDTKIEQLVSAVSTLVKNYCGLSFVDYYATEKTETFDIFEDGITKVFLDELPVVTLVSVEERAGQGSEYSVLGSTEYSVNSALGIVTRTNGISESVFAKGPASVRVVYTAGYQYTPKDLELAIYDMITYYLKDEHKERRSVVNSSIVNQSTSSIDRDVGFPDHIRRVLDMYKVNN